MKDIPIRFSDEIKDLREVEVVYYSDEVDGGINTAFVIKADIDTGSILLSCNQIVEVKLDSKDNCWWFDGQKLHVLVAGE